MPLFVFLMKAQITRKKINLPRSFFVILLGQVSEAYLYTNQNQNSKDIFGSKNVKLLLFLSI